MCLCVFILFYIDAQFRLKECKEKRRRTHQPSQPRTNVTRKYFQTKNLNVIQILYTTTTYTYEKKETAPANPSLVQMMRSALPVGMREIFVFNEWNDLRQDRAECKMIELDSKR